MARLLTKAVLRQEDVGACLRPAILRNRLTRGHVPDARTGKGLDGEYLLKIMLEALSGNPHEGKDGGPCDEARMDEGGRGLPLDPTKKKSVLSACPSQRRWTC